MASGVRDSSDTRLFAALSEHRARDVCRDVLSNAAVLDLA